VRQAYLLACLDTPCLGTSQDPPVWGGPPVGSQNAAGFLLMPSPEGMDLPKKDPHTPSTGSG
jgi:hypothetical protein